MADADNRTVGDGRRRAHVTLVGILAVVVLVTGVLSAVAMEGGGGRSGGSARAAGAPVGVLDGEATTTTPGALPPPPTPTTVPVRPPDGTAHPATTTTPRPSPATPPASSTVLRSTRAGFGPSGGPAVEIGFSPGRTSWAGVSNGVDITVRTDVAAPRAGQPVQFDIELHSAEHPCCGVAFLFGDGYQYEVQNTRACPGGGPHGPGPVRFHTSHTYNLEGRWTFAVSALTGNCSTPPVDAILFGTIEVAAGTATGQGPSLPQVTIDQSTRPAGHEDDYSWVSMAGLAIDADGWIRSVTVDWGDGSPPLVFGPAGAGRLDGGCQVTAAGWPISTRTVIFTGTAVHHYLAPGRYLITAAALSTACDGSSTPQQGTGTFPWSAPAPG